MNPIPSLLRRHFVPPTLLALLFLFALPACSTTERAADTTADAAENAAEATADVAEDVGDAVADAAGATYNAVEDVFKDDDGVEAAALLRPMNGGDAQGTITFEMEGDELEAEISLRGLAPGEHGLHVHTNASCSPPGNHFDPMNTSNHGGPDDAMSARHVGDLGNFTVDDDGTASAEMDYEGLMLTGANGLVGHAIVVHSGADDLTTDPSGDSGTPVACGVITGRM